MEILFIIKKLLGIFVNKYRLFSHQYEWRKKNGHNQTTAQNIFPIHLVKIGKFTYGPIIIYSWSTENEKLEIGDFCSIASGVKFILGGNHHMDNLSTFPFKYYFLGKQKEAYSDGPIILENDVWVGTDVTILSGITVGQGCVIAAGSVVTKNSPPYSVIGGVPAKIIRMRFTQEKIDLLKKINFQDLTSEMILDDITKLYTKINELSMEELKKEFQFLIKI